MQGDKRNHCSPSNPHRTSIYIAFPLYRGLWAISGRHTGGCEPATCKCCTLYIGEFNMGIGIEGDSRVPKGWLFLLPLLLSAQPASPALFPILLLPWAFLGLGSGLCQVVSLPSFKRPHSTKESHPPQTCNTAFSMPTPGLGSLGPWNSRSHFWSLHMSPCIFLHGERKGLYSLMPSLPQVVSSVGVGRPLGEKWLELENRAAVSHSEIVQFEYSKFTFIITVLVIMEQNLSQ